MTTACYCEHCSPHAVGATYSRQYRAITEARAVAKMAQVADRRAQLALVTKQRGIEAAAKLRADVLALWPSKTEDERR